MGPWCYDHRPMVPAAGGRDDSAMKRWIAVALALVVASLAATAAITAAMSVSTAPSPAYVSPSRHGALETAPPIVDLQEVEAEEPVTTTTIDDHSPIEDRKGEDSPELDRSGGPGDGGTSAEVGDDSSGHGGGGDDGGPPEDDGSSGHGSGHD